MRWMQARSGHLVRHKPVESPALIAVALDQLEKAAKVAARDANLVRPALLAAGRTGARASTRRLQSRSTIVGRATKRDTGNAHLVRRADFRCDSVPHQQRGALCQHLNRRPALNHPHVKTPLEFDF